MRVLITDKRRNILHLLIEENSIRSTERLTRVHRDTIDRPAGLWASAKAAGYVIFKRCLDVIVSLALLIIALPVLGAIAAVIKTTSRGPVLFSQRRLGRGGKEFWCYKFRTMVPDAELQMARCADLRVRFEGNYKIKDDPRVTRFGAFLRRTSLDELPQLWNVLRGEMSLIGPRPIVPPELSKYGNCAGRLLTVKPGLSGIWQVCGRSDTSYAERVEMDMCYIASRSLRFDLKLLLLTTLVVLRGRGAY